MRQTLKQQLWRGLGLGLALAMFIVVAMQPSMFAQSTGTVTGTVYDQAGAVVPKASIELVNDGTKDTRKGISNDSGYFAFANVQPGAYTLKISASGFKGWQQVGIPVRPGDLRDVPGIQLQVGAQGETVQVEAVAAEVAPVDSGERSAVLTSQQIEKMALLGRDATDLIRTLPGFSAYNGGGLANKLAQDPSIVSPTSGAVGGNYNGGGNLFRGGSDLTMDGAHILDNGCNCGATTTVNGDMVSEVKVQTSNFGADSAKGPLVVNVIGKSGTTSYHGEAYLHARDASLDSLDWAFKHQMLSSPKGLVNPAPTRLMYPGAQFGGPVPGTNKKVVFTTAFEYYYQNGVPLQGINVPGLLTNTVPTLSMRSGDFSMDGCPNGVCTGGSNASAGSSAVNDNGDLCNGLGFPGGNWSPLCGNMGFSDANNPIVMDPRALALMGQVPLPNADPTKTGGYNLLVPENNNQNGWMWRTRVDYALTDSTKIYATYQVQKETDNVPVHLWWQPTNSIPFPGGMSSKDNSQTVSAHFLKVINPTLTNDLSVGIGYINYPLLKNDKNAWTASTVGYPYAQAFPDNSNWAPQIGNGYWLTGMPQMIQPDIFKNGCKSPDCNAPFVWQKWNYSLEDSVTKVYKTHTIKMGFYWEKTTNNQGAFSDYNGHFEAQTNTPHTNPVANFLMGYASYDQVNKYALDNLWYPTYSGYVQDDWKLNKRLTLNLGLRADHLGEWRTPSNAGVATFIGDPTDPANNPSGSAPGFAWHGINSNIPVTGRNVVTITWEPRLGMALDLRGNGKTVLRGGWGEYGYRDQWNDYQNPTDLAQGVRQYNPGTVVMGDSIPGFTGINTIQGTVDPTVLGCGPGSGGAANCGNLSAFSQADHQQPLTRSYNFTISQQTPWSSLLEIGYVGSETLYAALNGNTNNLDIRGLNVIPLGGLFTFGGCSSPLSPTDANCDIARNFSTGNGGTVPGAVGAYTLGSAYGPNVSAVTRHIGKADYNGMQVSWVRQKGRLTYNLNYTWSKALGTLGTAQLNGANADGLDLRNNYGVLSIDRSHVLNMSYQLQTGNPVKGNKALGFALNGWTLSGITTYQSGGNITTQQDGQTNLNLGGNGPLSGKIQTDPNNCPIINGSHLSSCEQAYAIGAMNWLGTNNVVLQPTVICNPTANLKAHQYFNANCFSVSDPGQQGWTHLPYIHGPAYFNSDLAIFKTFKVTERQNVEFRLSAFNFLNHPLDSFQGGNGDNRIGFNYVGTDPNGFHCGAAGDIVSSTTGFCPLGSGTWVSTADTSPTSPGKSVHQGYASTRFGRRLVELSVKYRF